MTETTALGAAMAAGSAEGIGVWDLTNVHSTGNDIFRPAISEDGECIHATLFLPYKKLMCWII